MKTMQVLDLLIAAVNLRSACDMSRACNPIWASPISPSITARGVKAATESMTTRSTALERTSVSAISSACSPVSGWDIKSSSSLTPTLPAYVESKACSASINAAVPPAFWTWAMMLKVSVVFPEDSGPYISMTRPRGTPPTPNTASSARHPVGITSISMWMAPSIFMMDPLPNCFSICDNASSSAFLRFSKSTIFFCSAILPSRKIQIYGTRLRGDPDCREHKFGHCDSDIPSDNWPSPYVQRSVKFRSQKRNKLYTLPLNVSMNYPAGQPNFHLISTIFLCYYVPLCRPQNPH